MAPVARFNRVCAVLALAWLMGGIPLTVWLRPTYADVSGVYTSGLVARLGAWDALYPNVGHDTRFYVGNDAIPKPRMVQLAAERHVINLNPFLYPPWAAVLLLPMGFLSFSGAHWAWVLLLCFNSWLLAMFGGKAYSLCIGRETRMRGVVVLIIGFSMLTYRCVRVQNLSPLVALCLVVSVFSFMRSSKNGLLGGSGRATAGRISAGRPFIGGLAMMIGGGLKLASAALVPLAVAMRQWRTLAVAAALTAVLLVASYRMAGRATFDEYFTHIGPTLGYSSAEPSNKSLQGFLLRATGVTPLPAGIQYVFRTMEGVSLAGLLWLIFRQPYASWRQPSRVFAASAALIGWMLIFSPICWEHYFSYLCPFWGWLIWEASQGPWRRIAGLAAVAAQWVPLPVNPWVSVPEPINSYMLWGLVVMCAMAVARLASRPSNSEPRWPRGPAATAAKATNSDQPIAKGRPAEQSAISTRTARSNIAVQSDPFGDFMPPVERLCALPGIGTSRFGVAGDRFRKNFRGLGGSGEVGEEAVFTI